MKKPILVLLIVGAIVLVLIIGGLAVAVSGVSISDLFSKDNPKKTPTNNTNTNDNKPPVARIVVMDSSKNVSYDKTFDMNTVVWFDASGSSGNLIRYRWDFGDGSPPTEGTNATHSLINHTYTEKGHYTVSLMVTASSSAKASTNVTLTILGLPYIDSQTKTLSSFGIISSNATCNIPMEKDALNMTINITATGLSTEGAGTLMVEITNSYDDLMGNKTMTVLLQGTATFYFDASEISTVGTYFVKLNCEKGTMRVVVDINVRY